MNKTLLMTLVSLKAVGDFFRAQHLHSSPLYSSTPKINMNHQRPARTRPHIPNGHWIMRYHRSRVRR